MQNGFQQKANYIYSLPYLVSFLFLILLVFLLISDAISMS